MYKLGIDVGGTNTDAVLLDEERKVVASVKRHTTPDAYDGILAAVRAVLEQAGVDLLDISGGFCGPYRGGSKERGYFSDWSQAVKEAVSVPVLVTGGITQPEAARRLLEAGKADLVGVGRALLKDSLWAKRAVSIEAASV